VSLMKRKGEAGTDHRAVNEKNKRQNEFETSTRN
jgi:hypothetical protein